ncbi:hypothetical protein Bpfe_030507 [Biomphalaria pfeifferi]|uniref:Uncharacterized protein n=1 Tax=Biomphalaria pfeifferi TaxID=112525 RepID=A0AAD8EUU9_BIOPF|nr:hypothetical protein Bpfe_030507 [Biomphalaria pfeifferi]
MKSSAEMLSRKTITKSMPRRVQKIRLQNRRLGGAQTAAILGGKWRCREAQKEVSRRTALFTAEYLVQLK